MSKDLENRADIEKLIDVFYEKVHKEPKLSPYFKIPEDKWKIHLERTTNFWENWLFNSQNYNGGLMWAHLEKNREIPIKTAQFERWLALWFLSIDELFKGEKADFLKVKALELGQFMNKRINHL